MATIDINSISNAKLKQLATEIDNSNVSAKDNQIDDKEFGVFKQMAKIHLLDKKEITNDDYKAIFGLENNVNTDSLAYVQAQKDITRADSLAQVKEKETQNKNEKISKLKTNIAKMRNKLYKGKFNELRKDTKLSEDQKASAMTAGVISANLGVTLGFIGALSDSIGGALAVIGVGTGIGLVAGAAIAGVIVGGSYLYNKYSSNKDIEFMKQCEEENPQLYKALQYAEKELAKLEKNN